MRATWATAGLLSLTLLTGARAHADWGGIGSGPGQFLAPAAIAVGPTGAVYVADRDPRLRRVQAFTDKGAFAGTFGDAAGLIEPRGLATDGAGDVFVADGGGDRVVKLGFDGSLLAVWGSTGDADGQFRRPVSVAVDSAERVYVLDMTGRVQQFTSDGAFIARWSIPPPYQSDPADLAVAPDGDVFVLDGGSGVVTVFDPDGGAVTTFGGRGSAEGQSLNASGIAVDTLGDVFVADRGNHRVQRLSPQGAWIANAGVASQVGDPVDVAVGADGTLYVVDAGSARVVTLGDALGSGSSGAGGETPVSVVGVSGRVLGRAAGSRRFVPLKGILPIQAGWVIDARRGRVTLASGSGASASTVELRAGIVTIRLRRKSGLELALTNGSFAQCSRRGAGHRRVRQLSVTASGAAIAVRGRDSVTRLGAGRITVEDRCDGTLTRMTRGTATVTPIRGGEVRRVRAPHEQLVGHRHTS